MTTASTEAFARLQRAVQNSRGNLANLERADNSHVRSAEGVFIVDSATMLDAAEAFFGQFGDMDDGLGADIAAAGLTPDDMGSAIQHLSHTAKVSRKHFNECEQAKNKGGAALQSADAVYIASVKKLMDAAVNAFRIAKKPVPKPAPAPAVPKVAPIDPEKVAASVFDAVKTYVSTEMGKHSDHEREAVQRLINDKLGDLKDNLRTREDMRELKDMQAKTEMDRRLAGLGKTFNTMVDRRIEQSQASMVKDADRLAKMQARQVRKDLMERLQELETSDQHATSEMPLHEWDGTKIRFEVAPGVWGPWSDLEGPAGRNGANGGGGGVPKNLVLDGGGAFDEHTTLNGGTASSVNQFALGGGGANTSYSVRTFNGGRAI